MTTYIAFLRGIMPTNPNMRNEKLVKVFESLGLGNVKTVIASGNVIFDSGSKSVPTLESKIEKAITDELGFKSTTIIRSKKEIENLIKKNPFKGIEDKKPNYLVVTFFKTGEKKDLCKALDTTDKKTTDYMRLLEKAHGKEITTRTWKTVHRITAKMAK